MVKDPHPQATKMYRQILDILEELALLSTDATEEEEVDDSEAQVDTDIVDAMVEEATERGMDEESAERVFKSIAALVGKSQEG